MKCIPLVFILLNWLCFIYNVGHLTQQPTLLSAILILVNGTSICFIILRGHIKERKQIPQREPILEEELPLQLFSTKDLKKEISLKRKKIKSFNAEGCIVSRKKKEIKMADSAKQQKLKLEKKDDYPYPSRFGSHAKMVDEAATKSLNKPGVVVCRDEIGLYETMVNRLDNNTSDPNRCRMA